MASKMEQVDTKFIEFDEYDIMQNAALGAHCIYETIRKFEDYNDQGMILPISYLILPILYSNNYSSNVQSMNFKLSSFYKSIYSSKFNYLNVLEHADILFETSSKSILLAQNSDLIKFDKNNNSLRSNSIRNVSITDKVSGTDYKSIIASSRRLGSWFGQLKTEEILNIFN